MFKRALIIFFLFSVLYSFILTGDSYLSLGNDTSIIGLMSYSKFFGEHFLNDPILSNPFFSYMPSHLMLVKILLKITGSYLFTLKIILFLQVFFTLITSYILMKNFFTRLSSIQITLISFLIAIPFVMLPYGECVGFSGIGTAFPRSTFAIFTPLLLLYYYKNQSIKLLGRNIHNIIVLGFILGFLGNIHPPSAVSIFAVLLMHWAIFRAKIFRDLKVILSAFIVFLVASTTFAFPFLLEKFYSSQEALSKEYVDWLNQGASRIQILWLLKLTFIPFCASFLLLSSTFMRKIYEKLKSKDIFTFLKSLFIVAYLVDIAGALIYPFISGIAIFSSIPDVFLRTERFVFILVQLLIIYFVVNGKELLKTDRKVP